MLVSQDLTPDSAELKALFDKFARLRVRQEQLLGDFERVFAPGHLTVPADFDQQEDDLSRIILLHSVAEAAEAVFRLAEQKAVVASVVLTAPQRCFQATINEGTITTTPCASFSEEEIYSFSSQSLLSAAKDAVNGRDYLEYIVRHADFCFSHMKSDQGTRLRGQYHQASDLVNFIVTLKDDNFNDDAARTRFRTAVTARFGHAAGSAPSEIKDILLTAQTMSIAKTETHHAMIERLIAYLRLQQPSPMEFLQATPQIKPLFRYI